jgi:hypothetical protein
MLQDDGNMEKETDKLQNDWIIVDDDVSLRNAQSPWRYLNLLLCLDSDFSGHPLVCGSHSEHSQLCRSFQNAHDKPMNQETSYGRKRRKKRGI